MATELQLDSNSVDSGYAAATTPTSDSKDIGIFKQEINSVASLSTSSSAADADPQRLRRRVSLLEKIPREFSTFIRTQSQTRRESPSVLSDSSSLPSLTLDSAENEQQPEDKQPEMANTEDLNARKSRRSENRFYNFLTSHSRSRSRSTSASNGPRSKTQQPDNASSEFSSSSSHSRQSSVSSSRDQHTDEGSRASTSKRSTVIPSRPLSTNTTATNTTITPTTPKSRRQMTSPGSTPKGKLTSAQTDTTPKADDNRKKRTLFGFSLPSSRRTSQNSSRGASPASTSVSRRGSFDLSSASPVPKLSPPVADANGTSSHVPSSRSSKRRSVETELASRLKLGSSKTSVNQVLRVSHPRPKTSLQHLQAEAALIGNNGSVSRTSSDSTNHYSTSSTSFAPGHRRGVHSTPNSMSQSPDPPLAQSLDSSRTSPLAAPVGVSEFGAISRSSSSSGGRRGATNTDPGYRYHQPMAIVAEEPSTGKESAGGSASRLSPPSLLPVPSSHRAIGSSSSTSAMKRTKHGSLDLHPRAVADRNGDGGSGNGDGKSAGGAGSLHVQYAMDRKMSRGGTSPSPHSHENSASSHSDHKTSSWGRSTGKRGSAGIAHLAATSHGPFSFEPPVPSPTGSSASGVAAGGLTAKETAKMEALKEKHRQEREREAQRERERQRELLREQERDKRRREQALDQRRIHVRPEKGYTSMPSSPTLGFRSGTKGKELELDLGLSWAPTKIRQDALLPGLTMRRTTSQASSTGGIGVDVERLKIGKDIAESFRTALDDKAYAAFKKYVHRFDAHDIPLNGPNGIVARAERLLDTSTNISPARKQYLLDNFARVITQNSV